MADEDYNTNMISNDLDENELPNKLKKAQDELIKMKAELDEKNKLCLTQKHALEDLNIEKKDLEEKFNNQKKLLDFYDEKAKKEEEDEKDPEKRDKIKQLEMKIMNLNDKIKDLEEQMIKKDNALEVAKQELEEEKEISQKAAEMINEKDEEIEQLKKASATKRRKSITAASGDSDLSPEEVQALKEVFMSQQEEFDQYKETSEKKIKAYTEENTKLQNELNEIKDKNSNMEIEISR